MQVFTLCFLFLAASLLLVPGIALSRQSSHLRNTAASSISEYQGADREQGPIRLASIFQQNFSNNFSKKISGNRALSAVAMAIDAIARHAARIGGRPKASQ